jgi:hypothetical protein
MHIRPPHALPDRRLEAEAEAARKRRVAVTLDLVGRRVLLADPAAGGESTQVSGWEVGAWHERTGW